MNTKRGRHGLVSDQIKRILLGSVCLFALGLATAAGSSPAAAKYKLKSKGPRKQTEHVSKLPFGEIPKGPLEIFVSINQQKLHFYSGGVHVADALVATGVPGHLTPLGVFSVVERDRYHHSNIYDNAPMPFMERITWSGVALHQGPGVGRQASHGCIRMPEDFAARLWQLPTMGMRVIIARPELRPVEFADPHLFVHKVATPTAALMPAVQTAQTIDPGTKTDAVDPPANTPAPASPQSSPTAKPDPAAPTAAQPVAPAAPTTAAVTAPAAEIQAAGSATTPPAIPAVSQTAQPADPAESLTAIVKSAATDATEPSKQVAPAPTKPADAAATQAAAPAAAQAAPAAPAKAPATETTTTEISAPAAATPSTTPAPAEAAAATPVPDIAAPISLDDVPLPLAKPAQIARGGGGPIAIFVSRKNSRIYVRQDFTPVFDAPVKIEHPNEPIGTHVFTAMDYLPDHSTFRWTVTTLPGEPPRAEEHWKYITDAYGKRKRVRVEERVAASAEPLPAPETPQEALARIDIPQDVIDQISQLIVPGSSLIVSDQGLGEETGSGTDFIVVQR